MRDEWPGRYQQSGRCHVTSADPYSLGRTRPPLIGDNFGRKYAPAHIIGQLLAEIIRSENQGCSS